MANVLELSHFDACLLLNSQTSDFGRVICGLGLLLSIFSAWISVATLSATPKDSNMFATGIQNRELLLSELADVPDVWYDLWVLYLVVGLGSLGV